MAFRPVLASEELAADLKASMRRGARKALFGFTLLLRYSQPPFDLFFTCALIHRCMRPAVSKFVSVPPVVSPSSRKQIT